jgi:hypothetical protein
VFDSTQRVHQGGEVNNGQVSNMEKAAKAAFVCCNALQNFAAFTGFVQLNRI